MTVQSLTARVTVRASSIQKIADIKAVEMEGSKIQGRFWTLRFDSYCQVWRKEGMKPFTSQEALLQCNYQ